MLSERHRRFDIRIVSNYSCQDVIAMREASRRFLKASSRYQKKGTSMEEKFCKDCKHAHRRLYPEGGWHAYECHFVKIIMGIVNGEYKWGFPTVDPLASCHDFKRKEWEEA